MHPTGQSTSTALPSRSGPARAPVAGARPWVGRVSVVVAVVLAGALFAAALLLWARYGATVFFDTLSAGIAACM